MKVGVSNDNYPEKRTILVDADVEYVNFKKKNLYSYINLFNMKFLKRNKVFLFKPVVSSSKQDVDVFHLFNEVGMMDRNWVATFETELPRILPPKSGNKEENRAQLQRLSSALTADNCLALIALSGAAWRMEMKLFRDSPELARIIQDKMVVMHPPQKLYVTERQPRQAAMPIHFVFIGKDFYRKGGGELVRAFSELLAAGRIQPGQVKVTLIGDLNKKDNYALGAYQDEPAFASETDAMIARHAEFEHISSLPNEQVMTLLQKADVGLLPTWAETYGFSVLEMQSCGCPVITTNVRALPEINPQEAGWQVNHPLNDDDEYNVSSAQQRDALRRGTIDQLKTIIEQIVQQPEQIVHKANASIARIRTEHDIKAYRKKLRSLYNQR